MADMFKKLADKFKKMADRFKMLRTKKVKKWRTPKTISF